MKVIFHKDILCSAVQAAMSAVSNKNTTVAIDGIKITAEADGTCILNSFDMDKGIRCVIPGDVIESGSYIINGQKLNQMVRNMPGDITIEVDEKAQAKIFSGRSRFTISALPGDEFPNLPMLEGDWGFEMEEWQLKDMLNKTVYAVAANDPRPALNGVFFHIQNEQLTLVASDSFRLSITEQTANLKETSMEKKDLDYRVIVPGKTVSELLKMLGDNADHIRILATRKHIIFVKENICFFSRLIDADYIEYQKFMPKNIKSTVVLDKDALFESLERASLVTEDKSLGQSKSYVKCSFEDFRVVVSSISANSSVVDEMETESECEKLEIGFNCRFLLEALRAADSEKVKISLVSQLVSILIEPVYEEKEEDEKKRAKFTFLVVPIRMKE